MAKVGWSQNISGENKNRSITCGVKDSSKVKHYRRIIVD